MPGAVIDMQHDQGWVSAMLCTEKPQLCDGLMEGGVSRRETPPGRRGVEAA